MKKMVFVLSLSFFSFGCQNDSNANRADTFSQKNNDSQTHQEIEKKPKPNFQLVDWRLSFRSYDAGFGKLFDLSGTVTFMNLSGFDFTDMRADETLEYNFVSEATHSYLAYFIPSDENRNWKNNTRKKFKVYLSPLQDSYPRLDDFSRTPEFVFLKYKILEINIDKELFLEGELDLLPLWKTFQKQIGLR